MRIRSLLTLSTLLCLSATACGDKEPSDGSGGGSGGEPVEERDADGDGFADDVDCDDSDASVHPDAQEVCDGVDNNCDTLVDDDDPTVDLSTGTLWYADGDGDGFGDAGAEQAACAVPAGHVDNDTDCDDTRDDIKPDAVEVCDEDDVDEDCSGAADDDDPNLDVSSATLWFVDRDDDGFGNGDDSGTPHCDGPPDTSEQWLTDNTDCDDSNTLVNPDAVEVCDEEDVDEDCSGAADDADPNTDSTTMTLFYRDVDGDGFGRDSDAGALYCDAFIGVVADSSDCNDDDIGIHPDATEVCDELGVDENCNGFADDDDPSVDMSSLQTHYADADADGYGDDSSAGSASCEIPAGRVADNTDCDDSTDAINPGESEICDGLDNDCDSGTSEAGIATFVASSGATTDYTSTMTGSPASVSLATQGSLAVCDGTWSVLFDVSADVDIWNPSGVPSDVVLDGAGSGTVITIATSGVSVQLDGLSIENGYATGSSFITGASGGGIDCDASGATLSAKAVDILSNSTPSSDGAGGGISSVGCDLTLEDVVISDNTAIYGGGILLDDGQLTLIDSVLSDNTGGLWGGGLMTYDAEGEVEVVLQDTDVSDNTAIYGAGSMHLSYYDRTSLSCAGSSSNTAGYTGNVSDTGGAVFAYGGTELESIVCDFGVDGSRSDNSSTDVTVSYSTTEDYDFGDDETFWCTSSGCTEDTSSTISGTTATSSDTTALLGNMIHATESGYLRSFTMNIALSSASCTVDFYVLSNSSSSATGWTVEYAETGVAISSSRTDVSTSDINLAVTPGTYYALAVGSTCSGGYLTFGYTSGVSPSDAGFGELEEYVYDSYYTSPFTVGDTSSFGTTSPSFSFPSTVTVAEY